MYCPLKWRSLLKAKSLKIRRSPLVRFLSIHTSTFWRSSTRISSSVFFRLRLDRKLCQPTAGPEQSRRCSLDGVEQAWHRHSRHEQSGDNWPCRQSRLHSPGKLGRRAGERLRQRRQYSPHFLGGTRCPQRVGKYTAFAAWYLRLRRVVFSSSSEKPIHLENS